MIKIILLILVTINISYAEREHYFIKLGSFKNLNGLKHSINRLPYNLRSHIIIVNRNSWYIPIAYYNFNRNYLYQYLPRLKLYFRDAHIKHSRYIMQYPIIKNYRIKRVYTPPVYRPKRVYYQETIIPTLLTKPYVVKESKKYNYFTKNMLSGKKFYLAYKATKNSPNLLIKVTFNNHTVTYQPIIGDMTMNKANYIIDKHRLYMFADSFTENGAYSKLEERRENYLVVSSWANGKKLNTLRYYFNMNKAKEYLNIKPSTGLANILEEGKYDDSFLDNDDDY